MANGNVIRYIKQKLNDGGFDSPLYLGSETRFVSSMRGTNLNNLEEQLLIGCDTITEEWIDDDGNTKISKKFQDSSISFGYYQLDSIIYAKENIIVNSDFFIDKDETDNSLVLYLPNNVSEQEISKELKGETIETVDYNIFYINNNETYSINDNSLSVSPSNELLIRKDILYFISAESTKIIIEKDTKQRYTAQGKKIIKEIIYNHLKDKDETIDNI